MTGFYVAVGERIRKYRKLSNLTLEQLGEKIGVGKSTVRKYENGMIRISHEKMEQVADVLGIDVSLLYGQEVEADLINVPLYGQIACGSGIEIFETVEEYISTPKSWLGKGIYFYLVAKGDSMTGARIHEGDMLLLEKTDVVDNGSIAAVLTENGCVLKRVYKENNTVTLVSENPKYAPILLKPNDDSNLRIIGKLRKSITNFD